MSLDYLLIVLITSIPIILAALGEMLVERSGRVNLGVEGMMAFAASASVLVSALTGSPMAGLVGGMMAGLLLSLLYTASVIGLKLDQIVVGLSLTMAGLGLADLLASFGHKLGYRMGPSIAQGTLVHDAIIALTLLLAPALWITLYRTTIGIELRAIGYDEKAARDRGLRVDMLRALAISIGGILAGLAGAYMALILYGGKYFSGITSGWGWLAIGSVILGYWHPIGVAGAAYIIGLLLALRPFIESLGLPSALATVAPYLAVIIALTMIYIISSRKPHIRPPKVM